MRIVLLILLITTFSLQVKAMGMRTVPTNISCDMQDMPCHSQGSICKKVQNDLQQQDTSKQQHNKNCNNKDNCGNCNVTCLPSFINDEHQLVLSNFEQSSILYYEFNTPLKQHPDNLYRPPLIS